MAKATPFQSRTNKQLRAERKRRGISRRQLDRERQQARAANPKLARPQFWWVAKK